ncbi:protoporphyrinogen oxidase chloroplastic [Phtheirospermum japonicum]|uniref:Protoporphyrinogen oxidase n=1 Tax=Phtheirospermum japonicum TaxID=374723 RepID=A0A830BIJ3_9LAMI|nr:protoporphyrinogen oxidase chloroplastic [Phtheirospermum japonicum]
MVSFTFTHFPTFNSIKLPYKIYQRRDYGTRTIRASIAEGGPIVVSSSPGNNSPMLDCVIVGADISGLCIVQALTTKHRNSNLMVTEARECVGGNITTVERDGYLWEEGPNNFQPSDPMLTMAVDSGLKDELVLGDSNAPRFVLWNGKLRPVPSKLTDMPFFDLMSFPVHSFIKMDHSERAWQHCLMQSRRGTHHLL